jgi:hypothetical protein
MQWICLWWDPFLSPRFHLILRRQKELNKINKKRCAAALWNAWAKLFEESFLGGFYILEGRRSGGSTQLNYFLVGLQEISHTGKGSFAGIWKLWLVNLWIWESRCLIHAHLLLQLNKLFQGCIVCSWGLSGRFCSSRFFQLRFFTDSFWLPYHQEFFMKCTASRCRRRSPKGNVRWATTWDYSEK